MATKNRAILSTEKPESGNRKPESQPADPSTDRVKVRATQDFNEPTGHERKAGEVFETSVDWAQTLGANVQPAD
jgi:hypothetical protein